MKSRAWIALLFSMFAIGLLGAPAADARSSRRATTDQISGTGARLFWYIPAIDTNFLPERISSITFDPANPGIALASEGNSDGVILRTLDHGLTWARLTSWNPTHKQFSPRVTYGGSPHTFYAWVAALLYKSIDNGSSWVQVPYNLLCNTIATFAVHPANPAVLYIGTTNGFARSLDGGQTWSASNPETCAGSPHAHAIGVGVDQPNVVYAGEPYNYGGGVYRSTDQGATWENRSTGLPLDNGYRSSVMRVLVDPRDADTVYAMTELGKIYKTIDAGMHWSLADQGIEAVKVNSIVFDTFHGNTIYATSTDAVYSLADGAQSWQELDTEPIPQIASFPTPIGLQIDPAITLRPITFSDYGLYVGLPIPSISALSPANAPIGMHDFTLIVEGSDFTPAALVRWNGQERPTTFLSDTRLTATISMTDVLTTGVVPISVGYHRHYPYASDGASNTLPFTIQSACAVDGQSLPADHCAATVTATTGATLVYTSSASLITIITVPAGSVSATTVLSYTAVPTATAPAGFGFAGLAFTLDAYQNGVKHDGFAFTKSIAVSVLYGDADVAGLEEQTLTLDYWNGTGWVDAATTCAPPAMYTRHPETNRLAVGICHLSEFGVFGVPQRKVLLPLMRR
jgi:photosystem II stability/assembly factor-like uncharacterized protein